MEFKTELNYPTLAAARVSFTDFSRKSECRIASIPNRYKTSPRGNGRGLSRQLIMGRFFHELIESVSDAAKLGAREGAVKLYELHEQLIDKYETDYRDFQSEYGVPISEWDLYSVYEKSQEILGRELSLNGVIERERAIYHSNGLLFGIIDELIINEEHITIIEYKLKNKKKEIQTENNINQLHFYACLIKDRYPSRLTKLELVGLKDVYLSIKLDEDLCDSILFGAIEFARYLRKIGDKSIPVEKLCSGCDLCNLGFNEKI